MRPRRLTPKQHTHTLVTMSYLLFHKTTGTYMIDVHMSHLLLPPSHTRRSICWHY
jgi:hypothetical protein